MYRFNGLQLCLLRAYSNAAAGLFERLPQPKYATPKPKVDYSDLSAIAMMLYKAGIEEVSAESMIRNSMNLSTDGAELEIQKRRYVLNKNVHVIAFGKAILGMARAVEDLLGDHIVNAIAVVPDGSVDELRNAGRIQQVPKEDSVFKIMEAGSGNVPCEQSLVAAQAVSSAVKNLSDSDLLITLISGGGSGLLTLPKPPLTLEDKQIITRVMKNASVSTLEQNRVRKNLSLIKGGGLAEMASPAQVISLILSNLPHADAAEVASGPTTPDYSTPHQALDIFRKYGIESQVPQRILQLLKHEAKETSAMKWFSDSLSFQDIYSGPKPRYDVSNAINVMAGSDEIAVAGILKESSKYGIPAVAVPSALKQKSAERGLLFAAVAQYVSACLTRINRMASDPVLAQSEVECISVGMTKNEMRRIAIACEEAANLRRPVCIIFTSEILIELKGTGRGGPCQEVALATAIELSWRHTKYQCLQGCDVKLFSIDSDGQDGSTDVAGAFADCYQAKEKINGKAAKYYLEKNDSNTFYSGVNKKYVVHTGRTGTDIQNFQLLLIRNKTW